MVLICSFLEEPLGRAGCHGSLAQRQGRIGGPYGAERAPLAGNAPVASPGSLEHVPMLHELALLLGVLQSLAGAGGSLTTPLAPSAQRWGRAHRCVHHAQHRAGEDALRGGGGHVSDGEDLADAAASHGADRGECPVLPGVVGDLWEKGGEPMSLDVEPCCPMSLRPHFSCFPPCCLAGPVPAVLQSGTGVSRQLRPLCNVTSAFLQSRWGCLGVETGPSEPEPPIPQSFCTDGGAAQAGDLHANQF